MYRARRIAVVLVVVVALLAASSTGRAQSPDPWIETWKVNLANSTYRPGPKPTVAETVKMKPSPGAAAKFPPVSS
jgi:hypothetical protein